MITLYSYPGLYGLADNNAFGLKVFALMRLAGMAFRHEHILDTRLAPHGQLPYVEDDGMILGDSSAIVAHLIERHGLGIDDGLTDAQRRQAFCINRILDDLYWPMSYSRWKGRALLAAVSRRHARPESHADGSRHGRRARL